MVLVHHTYETTARCGAAPSFDPPLLMTQDRVISNEVDWLNRMNYHADFFSLYIVRAGTGTHIIDDVPYSVSQGDVYIMRPGSWHLYAQCCNLAMDALYFRTDIFDEQTRNDLVTVPAFGALFIEEPIHCYINALDKNEAAAAPIQGRWMRLTGLQYESVFADLAELQAAWKDVAFRGRASLIRCLFTRLVLHLTQHYTASEAGRIIMHAAGALYPASSPRRTREATVATAIKHMREHLAEELHIEQISASVFLSPAHFSKVFIAVIGQSPSDYLRHLRIEEAKRLLLTTNDLITDIAIAVGFGQASYFTRVFRAFAGTTPRAFRRTHAPSGISRSGETSHQDARQP